MKYVFILHFTNPRNKWKKGEYDIFRRLVVILRKLVAQMLKVPCFVDYPLILMILFLPVLTYVNNKTNLGFQSWPGAVNIYKTP